MCVCTCMYRWSPFPRSLHLQLMASLSQSSSTNSMSELTDSGSTGEKGSSPRLSKKIEVGLPHPTTHSSPFTDSLITHHSLTPHWLTHHSSLTHPSLTHSSLITISPLTDSLITHHSLTPHWLTHHSSLCHPSLTHSSPTHPSLDSLITHSLSGVSVGPSQGEVTPASSHALHCLQ